MFTWDSPLVSVGIYAGVILVALILLFVFNSFSRIFVYIRNDEYGVVEKLWSLRGSVKSGFMALNRSAGFQPELLRGGPHFFPPFQYRIRKQKLITVRNLAYLFARDGIPLPAGQTLAMTPETINYEDARHFLMNNGQRGPQRRIIREGIYAINTALFVVMTSDTTLAIDIGSDRQALDDMRALIEQRNGFEPVVIREQDDLVGVVVVHDGPVLEHGAIIAPAVGTDRNDQATFHNSFQDIEKFLAAGGRRGRQEQPLIEGTYYINRLFATVETYPKKVVTIGTVGVVVSYTGTKGTDVSGTDYRHGQLVSPGDRGVWAEPLPPGKYAFNPFAIDVITVPTTNFVLRWIQGRREDHGFDANLSEIRLITKDAFEPILPLSIVVHISPENAPRLIQQFADVKRLVDQTIDPMVSAYFKDAAQTRAMLGLINQRTELQADAKSDMRQRFAAYNIDLQEVLIGTPRAAEGDERIRALLDQIRDRQLAHEQETTYVSQGQAAREKLKLNESLAAAEQQTALTQSMIKITVSENDAKAVLRQREQEAAGIRVIADANAYRTVQEGESQGANQRAIGEGQAAAIRAQVDAFTGPGADYKLRATIAEILGSTIKDTKQPLVPNVMIADGAEKNGTMVEALLALMLGDRANGIQHTNAG
jgi:uncharacterized membrane protein YqiK